AASTARPSRGLSIPSSHLRRYGLFQGPGDWGSRCFTAFTLLGVQADLDDVWPEQQGEGPVDHNAQSSVPTRHLKQVVVAPDEPRQDPAYPDAEELTECLAVAQGTHQPQGGVDERPGRPA